MSNQRIKTPCVGLCSTVYGDVVCRGCKRFHHEVINWNSYGDEEKRAVWTRLEVLLVQVMAAKLEVFDEQRLRSQLEQRQIRFVPQQSPYCWAYQLIARGARVIRPFEGVDDRSAAFVTPAILDMTGVDAPDAEIFAPVLSVMRVPDFDAAMATANATSFGLSAGLISQDEALWRRVVEESRAGVVNRNRPTTGAAGNMPFGGLGASGNHRPSAYYAADYCAYPIASFEADGVSAVPVNGLNS